MTSEIEQGLKSFLTTQLSAAEITYGDGDDAIPVLAFTVSAKSVGLRAFTGDVAIPEIMPACIVKCATAPHMPGTSLSRAVVEIIVATPRSVEGYTDVLHRAIHAAVMAQLSPANVDAISTALQASGAGVCGGWADTGSSDSHTKGHWVTTHTLSPFGVRTV